MTHDAGRRMHTWDAGSDLLAQAVLGYAVERLKLGKDSHWGARSSVELHQVLDPTVSAGGVGGHEALRLFRDVVLPACRPNDHPMMLSYVPTAPSIAANLFDLVVSASSIFGGVWEAGAGAIAAEDVALRWLADLAGFPDTAGGCFVSGGSAGNLSALVTARHVAADRHPRPSRWRVVRSHDAHASIDAALRVMDVEPIDADTDGRGRLTGDAVARALDGVDEPGAVFAVVASLGTTNAGAVDELAPIAEVCASRQVWLHVDGAYGGAALAAPSRASLTAGIERADSFCVDPHKWLFAPYDCAALVYRDRSVAPPAHAQHAAYLDHVDRTVHNPADDAYHLSRRARGLPFWFSLATYGTDAYRDAVEATLEVAAAFAREVGARPELELVMEPDLSVVLFRRRGWDAERLGAWSQRLANDGVALVVPTTWDGAPTLRVCIVHPNTDLADLVALLDDLATT